MTFDREYFSLGHLDTLSYRETSIHRLDPRAKLIATIVFIISVVSFPKYEITGLLPFFFFPVLIFALGDIPVTFILKKVFLVSSFAFFIGIFNPLLDRETLHVFFGLSFSGGWISFFSIMLKFFLTVSAALLLIATTSFPGICFGLQRIGMPGILVSQLLFLYRYLFVLMEETMKLVRARDMRSFGKRGLGLSAFTALAGVLFVRTIERAERIYSAMLSRGFHGEIRPAKSYAFSRNDLLYVLVMSAIFAGFRLFDLVGKIGEIAAAVMQG